ncbi:MAG: hypothetical protein ACP5T6_02155 [Candidatus Micrarchaeia archaeon]
MKNILISLSLLFFVVLMPQIFSQQYTYGTVNIILNKYNITMMPNQTESVNFTVILTSGEAWGTTVKIMNSQDFSTNGIGISISNPYNKPNFTGSIMISLLPIQSGFITYKVKPGVYPIVLAAVSGDVSTHNTTLYLNVVNKTVSNSTTITKITNTTSSTSKTNTSKSSNSTSVASTSPTPSSNTSSKSTTTTQKQQGSNNTLLIGAIIIIIIIALAFIWKKKIAKTENTNNQQTQTSNTTESTSTDNQNVNQNYQSPNTVEKEKTNTENTEESNPQTDLRGTGTKNRSMPKQKKSKPKKGNK